MKKVTQRQRDVAFEKGITKVCFVRRLNRLLFAGDPEVRILGHRKDEERNTLSRETRARAERMVLDHKSEDAWQVAFGIAVTKHKEISMKFQIKAEMLFAPKRPLPRPPEALATCVMWRKR
ncbi:hypothetical protein [Pelagimonas phthalicica]|uniref:hypothetical protein n=1 Tax=Pelagimonas phthalicica TaxID=1037362 RepID=UPI001061C22C|nr:hypothetical protein [Pelagimonas phthalicica]